MSGKPEQASTRDTSKYYGIGHARSSAGDPVLQVSGGLVQRAVAAVTGDGDGLTFSRTRDGGAYCVAVLTGGVVEKWYAASLDELTEVLEGLIEACGGT